MTESKRFPYEKVAKLDSEERQSTQPAKRLVDRISVLEPKVILDIGVGTGYFAIPLAKALPEARIIGLDVEPRMFEILSERSLAQGIPGRIHTVEGKIDSHGGIDVKDETVDAALMVNLYHELDDRATALEEVRRALLPHGRLVICDWSPEGSTESGPPADHRVPADEVKRDLEKAGFTSVDEQLLYDDVYMVIASR